MHVQSYRLLWKTSTSSSSAVSTFPPVSLRMYWKKISGPPSSNWRLYASPRSDRK